MPKLWEGRFHKGLDKLSDDFNSSISFDQKLYKADIMGSIAHVKMLKSKKIIDSDVADKIANELVSLLDDIDEGLVEIDPSSEDIHSFVENELVKRIGSCAKFLHTGRSRNDQVALDLRLYLIEKLKQTKTLLTSLIKVILVQAKANSDAIMPGYTHLQRAQPITFAHYILAYANMFLRDLKRLENAIDGADSCPLGCAALAGTSFAIDRVLTAKALGFSRLCNNSIDGVSDRDFVLDAAYALSVLQMHLSRMAEEIVLYSSWEFRFISLDDSSCTGSSIMPQKKNPDIAELVRGKTGRVYGNLMALLTVLKGLPLAYNKDMQEDKEAIFDSLETVSTCISVFIPMIEKMQTNKAVMREAASTGFINATDCADYLTTKGLAFRDAYKITGEIVAWCIDNQKTLESMTLSEYQNFSSLFDEGIFQAVDLLNCLNARTSEGGASSANLQKQINIIENELL